jgi:hypothetical protein
VAAAIRVVASQVPRAAALDVATGASKGSGVHGGLAIELGSVR